MANNENTATTIRVYEFGGFSHHPSTFTFPFYLCEAGGEMLMIRSAADIPSECDKVSPDSHGVLSIELRESWSAYHIDEDGPSESGD